MRSELIVITAAAFLFTGCAHIKATRYEAVTTKDASGKDQKSWEFRGDGFEVFRAEPYLLVKYTQAKDKPVEVEIVQLPNFDEMTVIEQRPGMGNSSMTINLNGSLLTSLTTAQDSQADELLASVGTALTPLATLAGTALTAGATEEGSKNTAMTSMVGDILGLLSKNGGKELLEIEIVDEPCGGTRVPDLVTEVLAGLQLGTLTLEDPKAKRAAIWGYLDEVRGLIKAEPETKSDQVPCALLENLKTKIEVLDTSNRAEVVKYLVLVEEVDAKLATYKNAGKVQAPLTKVKAILLTFIGVEQKPDRAFDLYKIGPGGTLLRVAPK